MVGLHLLQTSSTPESPMKTVDPLDSEHELHLERQAVRKLDYTIISVMSIFYLLCILVRSLGSRTVPVSKYFPGPS